MPLHFNPASPLTAGRVPFSGGSGRLSDTGDLFWNTASRILQLGAGGAAASSGLQVHGETGKVGVFSASSGGVFLSSNQTTLRLWLNGAEASYFTGNGIASANVGDAAKFLRGDGSWQALPGGGDMLAANNLADVAARATAQNNLLRDAGTGAVSISAGGANQNIVFTPSGTGEVRFYDSGGANRIIASFGANTAGLRNLFVERSSDILPINLQGTQVGIGAAPFSLQAQGGNILIGKTTDAANGILQLATHTTTSGGIGFGSDCTLFRKGASGLTLDSIGGTATGIDFSESGTPKVILRSASGVAQFGTITAQHVQFYASNVLALTLDTAQRAIFAGPIRLANAYVAGAPGASTGTVTIQDSTGTTYRIPVLV